MANRPPDDCRARCPRCDGTGVWSGAALVIAYCAACMAPGSRMACSQHICATCAGSGRVCPSCCGMRYVRRDVPPGHADFGKALVCDRCCDLVDGKAKVNTGREHEAIVRYMASFVPTPPAERERARRAVAAASRADYLARHGDPRESLRQRHKRAAARRAEATADDAPIDWGETAHWLNGAKVDGSGGGR